MAHQRPPLATGGLAATSIPIDVNSFDSFIIGGSSAFISFSQRHLIGLLFFCVSEGDGALQGIISCASAGRENAGSDNGAKRGGSNAHRGDYPASDCLYHKVGAFIRPSSD